MRRNERIVGERWLHKMRRLMMMMMRNMRRNWRKERRRWWTRRISSVYWTKV